MDHIKQYFYSMDPIMGSLADRYQLVPLKRSSSYIASLAETIVSQQLSVKAAETIWRRFLSVIGGSVNPERIHTTDDIIIRSCGISKQKCTYLKYLASAYMTNLLDDSRIERLSDEQVMQNLMQIKGIGRWTSEMFLMFALAREDVFSFGDIGLQNAIKTIYGFKKKPSISTMTRLSQKWKPYRTYAARLFWRSLE